MPATTICLQPLLVIAYRSNCRTSLSFSTTSENTPLTCNGLQLGYNFEKFRFFEFSSLLLPFESKLDSSAGLLVPWVCRRGFFTPKLDTSHRLCPKQPPHSKAFPRKNSTTRLSCLLLSSKKIIFVVIFFIAVFSMAVFFANAVFSMVVIFFIIVMFFRDFCSVVMFSMVVF